MYCVIWGRYRSSQKLMLWDNVDDIENNDNVDAGQKLMLWDNMQSFPVLHFAG